MNYLLTDYSNIKIIDAVKRQLIQYFLGKTLGKYCKYTTSNNGFLSLNSIEVIQMPLNGWVASGTIESLFIPHYESEINISRLQAHEINNIELQVIIKNVELTLNLASQKPKESLPEDRDLDILQDQFDYLIQHIHIDIDNINLLFEFDTLAIKVQSQNVSIIPTIHEVYNMLLSGFKLFFDDAKVATCDQFSMALFKERIQIDAQLIHVFTSRVQVHKLMYLFYTFPFTPKTDSNTPIDVLFYFDSISLMYYLNPQELRPYLKIDLMDIMGSIHDIAIQEIKIYFVDDLSHLLARIDSNSPPDRIKQNIHEYWTINSQLREPAIMIQKSVITVQSIKVNISEPIIQSLLFTSHKWPKLRSFDTKLSSTSDFTVIIRKCDLNAIISDIKSSLVTEDIKISSNTITLSKLQFYLLDRCVVHFKSNPTIINYMLNAVLEFNVDLPNVYISTNKQDLQLLFDLYNKMQLLKQQAEDLQESIYFQAKETLDIAIIKLNVFEVHCHVECPPTFCTSWYRFEFKSILATINIGEFLEVKFSSNSMRMTDSNERRLAHSFTNKDSERLEVSIKSDPFIIYIKLQDVQYFIYPDRPAFLDLKELMPTFHSITKQRPDVSFNAEFNGVITLEAEQSTALVHFEIQSIKVESVVADHVKVDIENVTIHLQDPIAAMTAHKAEYLDYFQETKSVKIGSLNKLNLKIHPSSFSGLKTTVYNTAIALECCPDSLRILLDFMDHFLHDFQSKFHINDPEPQEFAIRMPEEQVEVEYELGPPISSDGFTCYLPDSGPLEIIPNYFDAKSKKLNNMYTVAKLMGISIVIKLFDGFDFDVSLSTNASFGSRSSKELISIHLNGLEMKLQQSKINKNIKLTGKCHVFEILDHLESSTWRKTCTLVKRGYQKDAFAFKFKKIESAVLDNELVFECKISPLKLNIDQDTLNFILNFLVLVNNLSFQDTGYAISDSLDKEVPYFSKFEISPIILVIDYKPKGVDFQKLRFGNFIEMVNLVSFENVKICIPRFKHAGKTTKSILNEQFIKIMLPTLNQQLVNAAMGIGAIKTVTNIGSGIADLVYMPVKQYQADGRVLLGMKNGINSFFESTTGESLDLGAKAILKTQELLKYVENMITLGEIVPLTRSKYSNQPTDMKEGLFGGFKALQQSLSDSIIAIKYADQQGNLSQAVPIILIKPLLGMSDLLGKTLLGIRNQIEPEHKAAMDDKYK